MANVKKGRYLENEVQSLALERNKMAFFSGPRQCGKTTMAKALTKSSGTYLNWDSLADRKKWLEINSKNDIDLNQLLSKKSIILDEFHKNPKWKNQLKGFYDKYGDDIHIILTGSAQLNTFKKGADSLLGRFINFNLHPFSFAELESREVNSFDKFFEFINKPGDFNHKDKNSTVQSLLKFGGFPEPYLSGSEKIHRIWSKNRIELLIRQDLKELSQVIQIGQVEILSSFLPERVGSPLSVRSLQEDLDVAHTTLSRWLQALELVYYHFSIRPYVKSIPRAIKKEPKIYLYDWSVIENEGCRYENMVASHLLKLINFYNDTGQANLELFYLRNKEKVEVDFIILKDKKPFFTIEAKLSEDQIDKKHLTFSKHLEVPHFQIVAKAGVFKKYDLLENKIYSYVISFDHFFKQAV